MLNRQGYPTVPLNALAWHLTAIALVGLCAVRGDDLSVLTDEFDSASRFAEWLDLGTVEGWTTPSYEAADIDTTTPGRLRVVPGPLTWFNHLRGLLLFKEVSGDFD